MVQTHLLIATMTMRTHNNQLRRTDTLDISRGVDPEIT